MSVTELWWLSLAIGAVVVVVVAVLLGLIVHAAKRVDHHAREIWTVGKQIAGNTVSIWVLGGIRNDLQEMQRALERLEERTASINESLRPSSGSKG